jgi:protein SCO1/2
MQPKPISHNKIIIFIVFICAALITSLFVFHMRHKQTLTVLANGQVTLFPVARDVNSFELLTTENRKFTQKDLLNHWTLIFFGFSHCQTVCPVTFDMLAHAYTPLHLTYPRLQVVFVSLDPERDTLVTLAKYTHSFNPEFIGTSGSIQNIRKLQSQLGIYSAGDEASTDSNYQIEHSSSILLINPNAKWVGIFKYGMSPAQFTAAFNESMKQYG